MSREYIQEIIGATIKSAQEAGEFPPDSLLEEIHVERPKDKAHGDFATNVAMVLGSRLKREPRRLAQALVDHLTDPTGLIERVEVAGPGFINFYLDTRHLKEALLRTGREGDSYGRSDLGAGRYVQVEFVSANPVGPLHLGHGRWAAVGDTLARLLEATGHRVEREFYVNDYGAQMRLFGESVAARYRELLGAPAEFPEAGYRGAYITDIAREIAQAEGDRYLSLSPGEQGQLFQDRAYRQVLDHLRRTLEGFGVHFDRWFSERTLHESGAVSAAIEHLRSAGYIYEKEGALWMRTSRLGDEKDRVLIRQDGTPTYFASDVAYHADKLTRGYGRIINIWGADHHGYVKRMQAAVLALGASAGTLEIIIGQMVNLLRAGQPVRMSKRSGEMVAFEELLGEVGPDAVRFIFLSRSTDSPLDFDIELAKKQSAENPVYYVQYAHARICSLERMADERGVSLPSPTQENLPTLEEPWELDLMGELSRFPEVVERAALERAPHRLTRYAEELAAAFHLFYTNCPVLPAEQGLREARLQLAMACRTVLGNVLRLLGVTAPERM